MMNFGLLISNQVNKLDIEYLSVEISKEFKVYTSDKSS